MKSPSDLVYDPRYVTEQEALWCRAQADRGLDRLDRHLRTEHAQRILDHMVRVREELAAISPEEAHRWIRRTG